MSVMTSWCHYESGLYTWIGHCCHKTCIYHRCRNRGGGLFLWVMGVLWVGILSWLVNYTILDF